MKTTRLWLLVMGVGFALMLASYFGAVAPDRSVAWSDGFLSVAADWDPPEIAATSSNQWPVQVRLVALAPEAELLVNSSGAPAARKRTMRAQLGELLVAVPEDLPGLDTNLLASGRLPAPGAPEVVAGCQVKRADKMVVEGQEFRVVGQLKRGAVAWADSFLLPQHVRWTNLFQPGNDATFQGLARASGATSVQNTGPDDAKTAGRVCRWVEAFSFIQVSRAAYWAYVGGYALLLLGGSGLFIACLRALARKNLPAVLGEPLREIEGHGGLLWSVHLGYFGLVIFGTLVLLSS